MATCVRLFTIGQTKTVNSKLPAPCHEIDTEYFQIMTEHAIVKIEYVLKFGPYLPTAYLRSRILVSSS